VCFDVGVCDGRTVLYCFFVLSGDRFRGARIVLLVAQSLWYSERGDERPQDPGMCGIAICTPPGALSGSSAVVGKKGSDVDM